MNQAIDFQSLYQHSNYREIADYYGQLELSPSTHPHIALLAAASYFKLDHYDSCAEICDELYPSFKSDVSFLSMYGAAKRRIGLTEASKEIFESALLDYPDEPGLINNYCNLLIDLGQFNKARDLLQKIIVESPHNLIDIQSTLSRIPQDLQTNAGNSDATLFSNPLLESFTFSEASQAGLLSVLPLQTVPLKNGQQIPSAIKNLLSCVSTGLQSTFISSGVPASLAASDCLDAARKLSNTDPKGALDICNYIHSCCGPFSALYLVAADIYIAQRLFADADLSLHIALSLGDLSREQLQATYSNLVNLSLLRRNVSLGNYYLALLKKLSASDDVIYRCEKVLSTNETDTPFQYVPSQAVSQVTRLSSD